MHRVLISRSIMNFPRNQNRQNRSKHVENTQCLPSQSALSKVMRHISCNDRVPRWLGRASHPSQKRRSGSGGGPWRRVPGAPARPASGTATPAAAASSCAPPPLPAAGPPAGSRATGGPPPANTPSGSALHANGRLIKIGSVHECKARSGRWLITIGSIDKRLITITFISKWLVTIEAVFEQLVTIGSTCMWPIMIGYVQIG